MRCSLLITGLLTMFAALQMTSAAPPALKLSGPVTHSNLTIFLLHGPDAVSGRKIVTLQEGMEKKLIVVHETSNVSMLSIENTSTEIEVFVMAGDVVKGGKQDRVIAFDQLIPSKSGKMPLPSFCVEHGRWRKRGGESDTAFASSSTQVCSKGLRNAVNDSRQQAEVWNEVAVAQKKLTENVGKSVQSTASASSLQLSLEDKDLNDKIGKYEAEFAKMLDGQADVIGMVAVVNGEVSSADSFGSMELFRKLWPKLLKSACTDAFAEFKADKKFEPMKAAAVEEFLKEAAQGEGKELAITPTQSEGVQQSLTNGNEQVHVQPQGQSAAATPRQPNTSATAPPPASLARVHIIQFANKKSSMVECRDKANPSLVLHRAYLAK